MYSVVIKILRRTENADRTCGFDYILRGYLRRSDDHQEPDNARRQAFVVSFGCSFAAIGINHLVFRGPQRLVSG